MTFRGREAGNSGDSYYLALERNLKTLEDERKRLIHQRNSLQKQLEDAKKEISKLTKEPLLIGTLIEILDNRERAIVRSSSGPSFVVNIAPDIELNEEKMVPGKRVVLNQRNFSLIKIIPTSIDPLVRSMEVEERPKTTYNDIGGLDNQILEIRESIELSLTHPELFTKVGIESPKGILLYGPPGSGKTLIARAIANQTNATFISIVGSEFVQKYIGEGARLVRELFQFSRKKAPAIIFIDELDAIGANQLDVATGGDREVQRTFMQLLSEMDGFSARGNIKIIGATNRVDILDPALLRAGRFDRHIFIPAPKAEGREEIFKIHTNKMSLTEGINFRELALLTDGLNGAEIRAICTEAGMEAIRERRKQVTVDDFKTAIPRVRKKMKENKINSSKAEYY